MPSRFAAPVSLRLKDDATSDVSDRKTSGPGRRMTARTSIPHSNSIAKRHNRVSQSRDFEGRIRDLCNLELVSRQKARFSGFASQIQIIVRFRLRLRSQLNECSGFSDGTRIAPSSSSRETRKSRGEH